MVEAESEASDAESPRFEDVGGGEVAPESTSGAGKAPLEEEEEEETTSRTSSGSGRNQNHRSLLLKSPPKRRLLRKRLARSRWQKGPPGTFRKPQPLPLVNHNRDSSPFNYQVA